MHLTSGRHTWGSVPPLLKVVSMFSSTLCWCLVMVYFLPLLICIIQRRQPPIPDCSDLDRPQLPVLLSVLSHVGCSVQDRVAVQCASLPSLQRRQAEKSRLRSCGAVPASRVAKRRQRLRSQCHAPSALGSGFGRGWRGLGNISGCIRPAVPSV